MIRIITRETFVPDLHKSIHYISWTPANPMSATGYSTLSWPDAIVRSFMPETEVEPIYRAIDQSGRTGTLYPQAGITLMPAMERRYSDEEICRHLNDALLIQNRQVQAQSVIIDLRGCSCFDPRAGRCGRWEYVDMISRSSMLLQPVGDQAPRVYVLTGDSGPQADRYERAAPEEVDGLAMKEFM